MRDRSLPKPWQQPPSRQRVPVRWQYTTTHSSQESGAMTWRRAQEQGLDPEHSLQAFDAYPLFASLGDAIVTGRSGNNLRDLRILLSGASLR
ncbi:MOFRL family protein [Granulicella sp. S156]|uniref:MOFRL family protein n=1 Tax=Granulicella sp. S156 TaxID=1747224 RepID=UPI00131C7D64|nr:MOFRL family protein [Granulicella sp. S156]